MWWWCQLALEDLGVNVRSSCVRVGMLLRDHLVEQTSGVLPVSLKKHLLRHVQNLQKGEKVHFSSALLGSQHLQHSAQMWLLGKGYNCRNLGEGLRVEGFLPPKDVQDRILEDYLLPEARAGETSAFIPNQSIPEEHDAGIRLWLKSEALKITSIDNGILVIWRAPF